MNNKMNDKNIIDTKENIMRILKDNIWYIDTGVEYGYTIIFLWLYKNTINDVINILTDSNIETSNIIFRIVEVNVLKQNEIKIKQNTKLFRLKIQNIFKLFIK